MHKKYKVASAVIIAAVVLLYVFTKPYSPEDKRYKKCNTNVGKYMPYNFRFGTTRSETHAMIEEAFPTIFLPTTDDDVEFVWLPRRLSALYDKIWFGFKNERLVAVWFNRRLDDLPNSEPASIERWVKKWYADFEAKSGYVNNSSFDVWKDVDRRWISLNGDVITFTVNKEGPKEQYNCVLGL
jgi:hypothetical protein